MCPSGPARPRRPGKSNSHGTTAALAVDARATPGDPSVNCITTRCTLRTKSGDSSAPGRDCESVPLLNLLRDLDSTDSERDRDPGQAAQRVPNHRNWGSRRAGPQIIAGCVFKLSAGSDSEPGPCRPGALAAEPEFQRPEPESESVTHRRRHYQAPHRDGTPRPATRRLGPREARGLAGALPAVAWLGPEPGPAISGGPPGPPSPPRGC